MKMKTLVLSILVALTALTFVNCGNSTEKQIKAAVAVINATLPMDIDEFTRLESVTLEGKDVFRYNYSVDFGEYADDIDIDMIEDEIKDTVIYGVKSNHDLDMMKDLGMTFVYTYADRQGNLLFEITVTPELYK